jgi:hypothetical protein
VEPRIMAVKGNRLVVSMKERFCGNRLHDCGRMFLTFTYKLHKKQGACVTPQNVTRWSTA